MKKKQPVALAFLTLSLGLIACGKSNDPAVVSTVGAAAPVTTIYPVPPGNPGLTLQQYCQTYNGSYNGSTCTVTQQYGGGGGSWQFNINIGGPYSTGVPIYSGQRVSVSANGSTKVYVGGSYMGSGSTSFVATTNGMLFYYLSSLSVNGGIQSVQVTTCMNAPAQAVACP